MIMDPTKAWSLLFEVYTDGTNIWAMYDGRMLGTVSIGQDIDGPEAALSTALAELGRAIVADPENVAVLV